MYCLWKGFECWRFRFFGLDINQGLRTMAEGSNAPKYQMRIQTMCFHWEWEASQ